MPLIGPELIVCVSVAPHEERRLFRHRGVRQHRIAAPIRGRSTQLRRADTQPEDDRQFRLATHLAQCEYTLKNRQRDSTRRAVWRARLAAKLCANFQRSGAKLAGLRPQSVDAWRSAPRPLSAYAIPMLTPKPLPAGNADQLSVHYVNANERLRLYMDIQSISRARLHFEGQVPS